MYSNLNLYYLVLCNILNVLEKYWIISSGFTELELWVAFEGTVVVLDSFCFFI